MNSLIEKIEELEVNYQKQLVTLAQIKRLIAIRHLWHKWGSIPPEGSCHVSIAGNHLKPDSLELVVQFELEIKRFPLREVPVFLAEHYIEKLVSRLGPQETYKVRRWFRKVVREIEDSKETVNRE